MCSTWAYPCNIISTLLPTFFLTVKSDVLISSIRVARRLEDLSPEEVADLFQTTVKVQKVVERVYNANSSTICVQDGQFAGQTVPVT